MHHQISLRVWHRTRSLQALIDVLAFGEPRVGRSVGEERVTRDGRVVGINRETFCTYELPSCQNGQFDSDLEKAVSLMESRASALQGVVLEGGVIEIYAGLFLDGADFAGFTVSPSLTERLAKLKLTTTIEIYP